MFKKNQTKVDLPNGSFEKLDENGFPLHWNRTGNEWSVLNNAYEGEKTCCITTTNKVNSWLFSGKGSISSPPIDNKIYAIESGNYYKIQSWIKGDQYLPVFLYLVEYDKNGKASFTRCGRVICFDDYQPIVSIIKTKPTSINYTHIEYDIEKENSY